MKCNPTIQELSWVSTVTPPTIACRMIPKPRPNDGTSNPFFSTFRACSTNTSAMPSIPTADVVRIDIEVKSMDLTAKTSPTMNSATKPKKPSVIFVSGALDSLALMMVAKVSRATIKSTKVSRRLPNSIRP